MRRGKGEGRREKEEGRRKKGEGRREKGEGVSNVESEDITNFIYMVTLKEGDKAPAFTGVDQDGKKVSLSDFNGKKLVLYFYSEAGSPTCTIESCNLGNNIGILRKKGFEVMGVSPDTVTVQKKFAEKYKLPFPLLADTSHDILEKYGVWDQKKLFGREYMGVLRTTFIIDEKGYILRIFPKPKNKAHAQEIIAALG